jgi:hypothetical protein
VKVVGGGQGEVKIAAKTPKAPAKKRPAKEPASAPKAKRVTKEPAKVVVKKEPAVVEKSEPDAVVAEKKEEAINNNAMSQADVLKSKFSSTKQLTPF